MRHILKTSLIIVALSFCGCTNSQSSLTKATTYSSSSSISSLNYNDVKDKMIFWSNIFGINSDAYYVYIFSKSCNHCANLKPFILEEAVERGDIYFVEANEEIVFVKDVSTTIGLTSIEGLGIIGYPTLLKIESKVLTKNLAGESLIRSELSIE